MHDHLRLLRLVSQLSVQPLASYDVGAALADVVEGATAAFGVVGCGVLLADGGGDPQARAAHPVDLGELAAAESGVQPGPCGQAFRTRAPVVASDLGEYDERWPTWCAVARTHGVGAVLAVPLRCDDEALGALGLYAPGDRAWAGEDVEAAAVLADVVAAGLGNAAVLRERDQVIQQLQGALDSRTVIEQAKGVVATRNRVPVDEAFEQIRRHARSHNVTVRAVAEAVVNLGMPISG